jgi:hypothetical protein
MSLTHLHVCNLPTCVCNLFATTYLHVTRYRHVLREREMSSSSSYDVTNVTQCYQIAALAERKRESRRTRERKRERESRRTL